MRKDRCGYACWGVAKTLGTKWVNNQLINVGLLKVAYCEFQLDLQCYFHCFSLAKQIIVYRNLWFIFVGQPVPISVVIRRQHCLASTQTVEKKQLLSPEEISPEATRSTARVLSYGWSFSLHDLESANQGDFSRCTSLSHVSPQQCSRISLPRISLIRWCKHWLCAEARFREQKL